MKTKTKIFAAALLGLCLPLMIAATSGGLPSRPRFQSVGIGTPPPSTTPDQVLELRTDVAGPTGVTLLMTKGTAGTDQKTWGIGGRLAPNTFCIGTYSDAKSFSQCGLGMQRTGVAITDVSFGNNIDNPTFTFNGTGAISGVGSGLTSLNATNLSSGTVNDARLSTNVAPSTGSGNFTLSTGCTTTPSIPYTYVKLGNIVVLTIGAVACTSNSTTFIITGVPAAIQPVSQSVTVPMCAMQNASSTVMTGSLNVNAASSTWSFNLNDSSTGWTSSSTKGTAAAHVCAVTFSLN